MQKPVIRSFSKNTTASDIIDTLMQDGGVIVNNAAEPAVTDQVATELRPHFDAQGARFQNDFNGYKTLRLGGILGLSRTAAELIAHKHVLEVADAILRPHCENYRIGSCTAIEILPGEQAQVLHHDDDFYPLRFPGVEFQISAMWALDDFTLENGATQVVPGSHLKRGEPYANNDDYTNTSIARAVMPKGSVLFYLGSTVHGGGANQTEMARKGLITTYSLGWLRQEENHYLAIPREIADSYPENIRRLMGYQSHGKYLGVYPGDPDGHWYNS